MDFPYDIEGQRIAVALSGGVDSAVTALLLKEKGADVFALTMRVSDADDGSGAAHVAAYLRLEHRIVDLRAHFRACVMKPFAKAYRQGLTPNPCAVCNPQLKFGLLADAARKYGAQNLATGHYALRLEGAHGPELHRGADETRDQSYFLFGLSKEQLAFSLFPLGEMTKKDVRALAASQNLPCADKRDSQDICFIPDGDYMAALAAIEPRVTEKTGDIVDMCGNILGRHDGISAFTVGQRKGLGLGARAGEANEPLYVLKIRAQENKVIVGPREALEEKRVFLNNLNILADDVRLENQDVEVQLRSTQKPVAAVFSKDGSHGHLVLRTPVFGVCPGQAGVIYHNTRVLGGGWISAL